MDSAITTHDVVLIGASAGGVEALRELARYLPADLAASVFVVLHIPRDAPSQLPIILDRAGPLTAAHAVDGEPVRHGRIYVAPPDHHMLLEPGRVRVVEGPIENRCRPAIDPLFRTAARSYGPRVVGVVLTGALDDGTAGLLRIKQHGGVAIVQDPSEALYPSMPRSALAYVDVDYTLPLAQIPTRIAELVAAPAAARVVPGKDAGAQMSYDESAYDGPPSAFTCPDCHGTLWEVREDELVRYQCRVGHAYSADSMVSAQDDSIERALWAALRSLEESVDLAARMAASARGRNSHLAAARFEKRRAEAERNVAVLRELLLSRLTAHAETGMGVDHLERDRP